MRWPGFLIVAYLVVLIQTTLGRILTVDDFPLGAVGPDFMVLLAVFIALNARSVTEAMLGGWVLGLLVDLTTAGGAGLATRVGPMAVIYCGAVWVVYRLREAFFRDRALPQMVLAAIFCLLAHVLWCTVQSLLGIETMTLGAYGRMMLQASLNAVYTALLMPLAYVLLSAIRNWMLLPPPSRVGRPR
jgi:rod shape-determining protein MreD